MQEKCYNSYKVNSVNRTEGLLKNRPVLIQQPFSLLPLAHNNKREKRRIET